MMIIFTMLDIYSNELFFIDYLKFYSKRNLSLTVLRKEKYYI